MRYIYILKQFDNFKSTKNINKILNTEKKLDENYHNNSNELDQLSDESNEDNSLLVKYFINTTGINKYNEIDEGKFSLIDQDISKAQAQKNSLKKSKKRIIHEIKRIEEELKQYENIQVYTNLFQIFEFDTNLKIKEKEIENLLQKSCLKKISFLNNSNVPNNQNISFDNEKFSTIKNYYIRLKETRNKIESNYKDKIKNLYQEILFINNENRGLDLNINDSLIKGKIY